MSWIKGSKSVFFRPVVFTSWSSAHHLETKESKENGVVSRSVTPIPSRPVTPKPPNGSDQFRSGMLTIKIFSGLFSLYRLRISINWVQDEDSLCLRVCRFLMSYTGRSSLRRLPRTFWEIGKACSVDVSGGSPTSFWNLTRMRFLLMPWVVTLQIPFGTTGQTCTNSAHQY